MEYLYAVRLNPLSGNFMEFSQQSMITILIYQGDFHIILFFSFLCRVFAASKPAYPAPSITMRFDMEVFPPLVLFHLYIHITFDMN